MFTKNSITVTVTTFLCFFSVACFAQDDTLRLYYNKNWQSCEKDSAQFMKKAWTNQDGTVAILEALSSGTPLNITTYSDLKNGMKQGRYTKYHSNLQIQEQGDYSNNKHGGVWRRWHANGQLKDSGIYVNGKVSGLWVSWFDDGAKDQELFYKNNDTVLGTFYFRNGQKSAEEVYIKARQTSARFWDSLGNPVAEGDVLEPGYNIQRYLSENVTYPEAERNQGIMGVVLIGYWIEPDGTITGIEIEKSATPAMDAEAYRAIANMPKWKVGKMHNRLERVHFNQPVTFKLE